MVTFWATFEEKIGLFYSTIWSHCTYQVTVMNNRFVSGGRHSSVDQSASTILHPGGGSIPSATSKPFQPLFEMDFNKQKVNNIENGFFKTTKNHHFETNLKR